MPIWANDEVNSINSEKINTVEAKGCFVQNNGLFQNSNLIENLPGYVMD